MGEQMAKPKTSVERSREEAEQEQLNNLLGGAFGGIEQLTPAPSEEPTSSSTPLETKSEGPPSSPPNSKPSSPPTGPPTDRSPDLEQASTPLEPQIDPLSTGPIEAEQVLSPSVTAPPLDDETEVVHNPPETGSVNRTTEEPSLTSTNASSPSKPLENPPKETSETGDPPSPTDADALALLAEKELELERLHMENARLRQSVVGASEVIEQLEEPPMPPVVEDNIVIPGHVVADFVRIGRQLDREHLVRATMGSVAMLHPEQPNIMISSRHMTPLPRMNERSLCSAYLGTPSPRGAPVDWHALEVVLASVSMVTGGPAAVVHMHGAHTTAASCEKDLIVLNPIDELGQKHIGKIVVVDPDPEHPEDFLRQVAEALQQGGMRCVVLRGNGAYAVGADFDQAWANAAMLEHSMQIHLLARQANLKL